MTTDVRAPRAPVPNLSTFAARLAAMRHDQGHLNIAAAARLWGFSDENIRRWEAGGGVQNYEHVCRQLAKRTGYPVVWIMTGQGDAAIPPNGGPGAGPESDRVNWLDHTAAA